ncbi:hypothetical protein EG329_007678 [Mollisiaceae sp. DMI_Dod_QoI]|nr:hypothetical protein EG329_007678 [Helotiales sp. DMI_Dod_QoI]
MLDIDVFPSHDTAYDHHESYTALCISAATGCTLCQCIKDEQSRHLQLADDFDASFPPEDRQIKCFAFDRKENVRGICRIRIGQHVLLKKQPVDSNELHFLWVFFGLCVKEDDPLSDFKTVDGWLQTCLKDHPNCNQNPNSILPTRVINVGSTIPFLQATQGQRGAWVTLSHCWGTDAPLTTTTQTLRRHSQGIPLENLPPTFKDAIEITRRLGFQYIWIDSLCILQDSRSDWLAESSTMREVYRNAAFNISADASPSPSSGIFASANSRRSLNDAVIKLPFRSSKDHITGEVSFHRDVFPSQTKLPLQERAWVLQESTFSPRRIRYLASGIQWTCETIRSAYEEDPILERIIGHRTDPHSIFQMPRVQADDAEAQTRRNEILAWWYERLRDYLGRQITFLTDRLPAIAGVAKEVAERTGYHYRCGLWEEDFLSGLLWAAPGVGVDLSKGPSWSWAIVDCRKFVRAYIKDGISSAGILEEARAQVLDIQVQNPNDDPFGQVESGRIVLRGPWRSVVWGEKPMPFLETYGRRRDILERHRFMDIHRDQFTEPSQISLALDRRFDGEENENKDEVVPRDAIYLQINRFGDYDLKRRADVRGIHALVLQPTGKGESEFRRIGMAQIPEDEGMADDWPVRTVTII